MSILTRAFVLTALAVSPMAAAMTLGPLVVQSRIGQPFQATIAVHGARGPVRVHMAPRAAFRAAGMKPPARGTAYRFRVTGPRDHRHILVTSAVPIDHPHLTLLLVVDSAHGSRVQEYHAALRPVLLSTMHVQSGVEPSMMPAHRDLGAPPGPAAAYAPPSSPYRVIGPIRPGESLLQAARAMDPGHRNVGSLMEALVHTNPGAFLDDNANGLRVGAVLHRPDPAIVRALSTARALQFLRDEYTAWVRAQAPRHHATISHAVVDPAPQPAPMVSRPLASAPAVKPQSPHEPARARSAAWNTPTTSALLSVMTQPAANPIPETSEAPVAVGARSLSAMTLAVTGVMGHPVRVAMHAHQPPAIRPSLVPHPAPVPHGPTFVFPAQELADLVILIIAVLGVRQFLRHQRTAGTSLPSLLARLFTRPSGRPDNPPTPVVAATPVAPVAGPPDTVPIPSHGPSPAPEAPVSPPPQSSEPPSARASSLVVVVAHREDHLLRLDLARTYVDLGEFTIAREILTQVRAGLEAAHKPALDGESRDGQK